MLILALLAVPSRPGPHADQRVLDQLALLALVLGVEARRRRGRRACGRHRPAAAARCPTASIRFSIRGATKNQAPMLRGSSWHQTNFASLGVALAARARAPPRGTGRAPPAGSAPPCRRAPGPRAPAAGRNRPCRVHSTTRSTAASASDGGVLPEHAVEARARAQLVERADAALVPQQRLRRHHDQRLAELAVSWRRSAWK